jgi:hypothetical protein
MKRTLLAVGFLAAALLAAPAAPLRADDFRADVKFVQVDDVKLAYYMRGEGKNPSAHDVRQSRCRNVHRLGGEQDHHPADGR